MRVACVYIANLAVQVALIENPHLQKKPVVIGGSPFDKDPVIDASPEAMTSGVKIGMPLRRAYSLCPGAIFLPDDENMRREIFENILEKLDDFSPVVETDSKNCAFLDTTGVKNERETALKILGGVNTKVEASLGLCSGRFFAWAAAFSGKIGEPAIISPGGEKNFIAPFPVDLLPCSTGTKDRLHLLGIRRVGQLADFSLDDLAAQFGVDGKRLYDLSQGYDHSLLVPRKKPDSINDAIDLFPPSIDYLEILKSCEVILVKQLSLLRLRGKLCSEAILMLSCESTSQEMRLIFKEATCSEVTIMKRIRACVENTALPSPAASVGLKLMLANPTGRKLQLWQGDWGRQDSMRNLIERLQNRFGYQPLKKIEVVESDAIFPERRTRLIDIAPKE